MRRLGRMGTNGVAINAAMTAVTDAFIRDCNASQAIQLITLQSTSMAQVQTLRHLR